MTMRAVFFNVSHRSVDICKAFADNTPKDYLADSPYVDDLEHITRCFDKTTKPRFRSASEPQYVRFGSVRDNDPTVNIRSGQLKLQGSVRFGHSVLHYWRSQNICSTDVALFFQPAIDCIVKAVQEQRHAAHKTISVSIDSVMMILHSQLRQKIQHVIFVGGFGASDYLLNQVTKVLQPLGLSILRPESHVCVLPVFRLIWEPHCGWQGYLVAGIKPFPMGQFLST